MNLRLFLNRGISGIFGRAARFALRNPAGRRFVGELGPALRAAADRRAAHEAQGLQVPPFLIASVASWCNLRCAGCYARAGGCCSDAPPAADLRADEWADVFAQARDLGVSFVLLAGGEPLLRRDILEVAAGFPELVFPVFTNGTLFDEAYLEFFARHRNLLPVLSVEGDRARTDARRGEGVHDQIAAAMGELKQRGLFFGASITLTSDNLDETVCEPYLRELRDSGCGLVFYVEYVPAESGTEQLVLTPADQDRLAAELAGLKRRFGDMILLAFPGDEEAMGGCLAAGRGFFHISAAGAAEPCPFAPVAAQNVRAVPLADVLRSRYFAGAREIAAAAEHSGCCALFARRAALETLVSGWVPGSC